eukprot:1082527-Pleurochrysis_carterae.AAC.1
MFMRWRRRVGYRQNEQESLGGEKGKKVEEVERGQKRRPMGLNIGAGTPEAYILAKGALILSYLILTQNPRNGCLRTPAEAYILDIVYLTSHNKRSEEFVLINAQYSTLLLGKAARAGADSGAQRGAKLRESRSCPLHGR